MSRILDEVLAANARYAEAFGDKGNLALPPSRRFAILTCMDARLVRRRQVVMAGSDGIEADVPRESRLLDRLVKPPDRIVGARLLRAALSR